MASCGSVTAVDYVEVLRSFGNGLTMYGGTFALRRFIAHENDDALRLGNHPAEQLHGKRVGRLQFEAYAARSLLDNYGRGLALHRDPWLH